ncbi:MAG: glutamate formimidoyltransferase [Bacteroidota bacterium]|jgi:glutamate formiminotransferase/formiminotetrahydrofolate cyclodeaminase
MKKLIECVPNFSEGRDLRIIDQIAESIRSVEGVSLLNVDPGKATNRTVMTLVGEPASVCEAVFRAISTASRLIDMRKHQGEHPRMGATDVCPLIPVSGISMEETAEWSKKLAQRVGSELNIPVYLYEDAQEDKRRSNLSIIRAGEYEGFFKKITLPEWKPDFGPSTFHEQSGATVIGARDFLIAYNVNLNTKSVKRANSIAFDVREAGRVKLDESGKKILDADGQEVREPGLLKGVKAIGWYIDEYGIAQVSINITHFRETPLHVVFEACNDSAYKRGQRVTGSELVGLVPLSAMLEAGRYFLNKQRLSSGVSDAELIHMAVKSMGLDELAPFNPQERIIEYCIEDQHKKLVDLNFSALTEETASESPAPGGGSISAAVGALGISLATMVANLSAGKKGWEHRWEYFSKSAERGQELRKRLLFLVDEDTRAFNAIMDAFKLPKGSETEKETRKAAVQLATKHAIEIPLEVMKTSLECMHVIAEMAKEGNPNSVSDAGVGALCARTAVLGAHMNVRINASGFADKKFLDHVLAEASRIEQEAIEIETEVIGRVNAVISAS